MNADTIYVSMKQETVAKLLSLRSFPREALGAVVDRLAGKPAKPPGGDRRHQNDSGKSPGTTKLHCFIVLGEKIETSTLVEGLVKYLRLLADLDDSFLLRFAEMTGRTRHYVARRPELLYPGRPDLAKYSREFVPGWHVVTNNSREDTLRICKIACEACCLEFGKDVLVWLSNPEADELFDSL
jgi:hypothetical protein